MNALLISLMLCSSAPALETLPPVAAFVTEQTVLREVKAPAGMPVSPFLGGGLFIGGLAMSLITTGTYWFSGRALSWGEEIARPLGMVFAAIPFGGPVLGILAESKLGFKDPGAEMRVTFNVIALAMQVGGVLVALNTPNELRQNRELREQKKVVVTGVSIDPLERGAAVRLQGTFDFVR